MYPETLLVIYRDSQDMTLKLMALLCLKTYFSNTMTAKKRAFKKAGKCWPDTANIKKEEFAKLRAILVEATRLEFSPALRKQLDEVLVVVCCCRYPLYAEEFFMYLKAALENLAQELGTGHVNEKSYAVVKTAVKVFQGLHKANQYANDKAFDAIVSNIFPALVNCWEILTNNLDAFVKNKHIQGLKMNLKIDTLFLYMLLNAGEAPQNNVIEQCLTKLIDKSETVLGLAKQNEHIQTQNDDLYCPLRFDVVVLTYDLAKIMGKSPFSFSNLIKRLMNLSFNVLKLDWKDVMVPKSALLLLYGILRQFFYYCETEYFISSKMQTRMKVSPGLQQHCRSTYFEFLNKDGTVQQLVSAMILKLMCINDEEDGHKSIESEIESSEVTGIDHLTDEIEVPIKRICISVIELLSLRVPQIMVPMLIYLIESVVSGNMKDAELKVKDNIIMLIGLLPTVYQKLKRTDTPNIDGFLGWFSEQSNS